jgi:hypothetical protein
VARAGDRRLSGTRGGCAERVRPGEDAGMPRSRRGETEMVGRRSPAPALPPEAQSSPAGGSRMIEHARRRGKGTDGRAAEPRASARSHTLFTPAISLPATSCASPYTMRVLSE